MKSNHYVSIFFLIIFGSLFASADFAPPTKLPPGGNTAPPIHTGNVAQIKRGALGIQLSPAQLDIPQGVGLYTDSSIGVRHGNYTKTNPDWKMNAGVFALDTNAPISVNGVFSAGPIRSEASIIAPNIAVDNLKLPGQQGSRRLCADTESGELEICTEAVGSQLQVSLSALPQHVLPNSSSPVTVSWRATAEASTCTALEGDGFSTGGRIVGSDTVRPVTLQSGETAQYVIVCTDAYGNIKIASTEVTAQERPPIITLSINPPVGGWSNGAFFTTGVTLDPNGGGTMNCRKKVDGAAISASNGWSGRPAGQWSSVTSIPPGNSQSLNTCYNGCQFKDIVTEPNSSASLTLQCSNASATTTRSEWISVSD